MRIELPTPSWADTVSRADDDAHTLTVAVQPAMDWLGGSWSAEPVATLRTEVVAAELVVLTLTL